MYNSRTPSPLEYQFPNNVNTNTFYGQASLSKINVHPPTGKLIFYLYLCSVPNDIAREVLGKVRLD